MWKTMWKGVAFLAIMICLIALATIVSWKIARAQPPAVIALESLRRPDPGITAANDASTLLLNAHRTHLIALRDTADGTTFYDHVGNKYVWDAAVAANLETQITEVEEILSRLE